MSLFTNNNIGTLVIELTAEGAEYFKTLKEVEDETQSVTGKILNHFKYAGAGIAASLATLAIVGVKNYSKLEDEVVKGTANMKGATAELRSEMENLAIEMSNEGKDSAEELARAYGAFAESGKTAQHALNEIRIADEFANAASIEAAEGARMLSRTQAALGLTSRDVAKDMKNMAFVAETIVEAAKQGGVSITAMGQALESVGSQIRQLNGGVTEGAAIIAGFTQKGISAGEAAGNLAYFIRVMNMAVKSNAQEWKNHNIEVRDAAGNMRPMAEIIEQIERATNGLSDAMKNRLLDNLGFGARAFSTLKEIIGTSGYIKEFRKEITGLGDDMKTAAELTDSTFSAEMKRLYNNLENMTIKVGKDLVPAIRAAAETFEAMDKSINSIKTVTEYASETIGTLFTGAVWAAVTAMHGWAVILTGVEMLVVKLTGALERADTLLSKLAPSDSFKEGEDFKDANWGFGFLNDVESISGQLEASKEAEEKLLKELDDKMGKLLAAGNPADEFLKKLAENKEKMDAQRKKAVAEVERLKIEAEAASTKHGTVGGDMMSPQSAEMNRITTIAGELKSSIKNVWTSDVIERVNEYKEALKAGAVSADEFNQAMYKMKLKGTATTQVESVANSLVDLKRALTDGRISQEEFALATQREMAKISDSYEITGNAKVDEISKLKQSIAQEEMLMAAESANIIKWTNLTEEQRKAILLKHTNAITKAQNQLRDAFIDTSSPLHEYAQGIEAATAAERAGIISKERYAATQAKLQRSLSVRGAAGGGHFEAMKELQEQQKLNKLLYAADVADAQKQGKDVAAIKSYWNDVIIQNEREQADRVSEMHAKYANQLMSSFSNVTDGIMSLTEKGTAAYKAAFIASKMIAIATTIIETHVAAMRAVADLGPIYGPPMAAAITALGYANVAIIAATSVASFEGGGRTPDGARTGGVDGKGGFIAVLHPNEKITDMEKPGSGEGSGSRTIINVHNHAGAEVSTHERRDPHGGKVIEMIIKRAKAEITSDIIRGEGQIPNVLQRTYSLTRGVHN